MRCSAHRCRLRILVRNSTTGQDVSSLFSIVRSPPRRSLSITTPHASSMPSDPGWKRSREEPRLRRWSTRVRIRPCRHQQGLRSRTRADRKRGDGRSIPINGSSHDQPWRAPPRNLGKRSAGRRGRPEHRRSGGERATGGRRHRSCPGWVPLYHRFNVSPNTLVLADPAKDFDGPNQQHGRRHQYESNHLEPSLSDQQAKATRNRRGAYRGGGQLVADCGWCEGGPHPARSERRLQWKDRAEGKPHHNERGPAPAHSVGSNQSIPCSDQHKHRATPEKSMNRHPMTEKSEPQT